MSKPEQLTTEDILKAANRCTDLGITSGPLDRLGQFVYEAMSSSNVNLQELSNATDVLREQIVYLRLGTVTPEEAMITINALRPTLKYDEDKLSEILLNSLDKKQPSCS